MKTLRFHLTERENYIVAYLSSSGVPKSVAVGVILLLTDTDMESVRGHCDSNGDAVVQTVQDWEPHYMDGSGARRLEIIDDSDAARQN